MADKRISQLIERVDIANNDVLPIVASGATTTNKVTISTIQNWMQDNLDVGVTSVGITLGSSGTDVNVTGSPITTSGNITINIPTATATIRGVLSPTDWSTFNNKVPYTGATGNVNLGEYGISSGFVTLDTTPTGTPASQGTIYWDDSRSTAALIMNGTTQHIGQDSFFYVKNSTGYTIPKGTGVGFAGTDGASGHLLIQPFLANGSQPSTYFMGVTAEAITNGGFGQVMQFGELSGVNTSGYSAGALLYASTSVAGAFQTTAPQAPNNIILVAAAVNSTNNGSIIVRPQIGSNIKNDEGVKITSVADKDLLQYQSGTGLWENKTRENAGVVTTDTAQTITGEKTFSGSSLRLAANGTADAVVLRNVSGTTGSDTGATTIGFNGSDNLFINTQSRGGFILGFNNSVSNREYTLPDASGTIALTSNLSSYLPLSGGTLTGALNGTSASFSGSVGAASLSGAFATLSNYGSATSTALQLGDPNNGLFRPALNSVAIATNGAAALTIASTGAATFSSSVTAGGIVQATSTGKAFKLLSTDTTGSYIEFSPSSGGDYGYIGSAYHLLSSPNNIATNLAIRANADLSFAAGGSAERFRISSTGNVGIGTASPVGKFEIASAANTYLGAPAITFTDTAGSGNSNRWIIGNIATDFGSFNIASAPTPTSTTFTPRLTITNSGNVGINVTSPSYKLQVDGNVYFKGASSGSSDFAFIVQNSSSINNLLVRNDGNVIVGSTSTSNKLELARSGADWMQVINHANATDQYFISFRYNGTQIGTIIGNNTSVSYNTSSDYRLKENVKPVENALSVLTQLKPCTFNFIADSEKEVMGFLAHEVQEIIPQAVSGQKDEVRIEQVEVSPAELDEEGNVITEAVIEEKEVPVYQGIDHSKLVPLLVASIQELKAEIEALKSQING